MTEHRLSKVSVEDLIPIARGAALLGTGGGGDPYIGRLLAESAIREYGPVRMESPDELPDDATVMAVAMMGAPTVMVEKPPTVGQLQGAITALATYTGKVPTHISCLEVGGINSMIPLVAAARLGLPLVDGDGMGRAFPEVQMVLPTTFGVRATPMGFADEKGNIGVIDTIDNTWTERIARPIAVQMGSSMMMANYLMNGAAIRESFVLHTVSLSHQLGTLLEEDRQQNVDPIPALVRRLGGSILMAGKVADVSRKISDGFTRGQARIEGIDSDAGRVLVIFFQNENLLAELDGAAVVTTPDLIMVLDNETGEAITTDTLRYGQRVRVIASPADPRWHSPSGIELAGPRRFGYDIDPIRLPITHHARVRFEG